MEPAAVLTLHPFFRNFGIIPPPSSCSTVFSFCLAGLLGYALGSIPTAFLLVHWKLNRDIRSEGSGNVGTLNSYEVTGSTLIGALVLTVDLLKGIGAVLLARGIWGGGYLHPEAAGVAALLGHNYPVWLGFKGGRGLATGAGVMGAFGWMIVGLWGLCWAAAYPILRSVNPANAAALIVTILFVTLAPDDLLRQTLTSDIPLSEFRIFGGAVLVIILMKHIEPVRLYVQKLRNEKRP